MLPMFKTHNLPPPTQAVFQALAANELTSGFLLIGGTALALHIGHRLSNDLDFIFCDRHGKLPTARIDALIRSLRDQGCKADLVIDSAQESAFRINSGERLSDYARDYNIEGVKVTFFAASPQQQPKRFAFWQSCPRDLQKGCAFAVLALDALKTAKTVVLQDRVRSRDLFDLMVLMRDHGYTIEAFFDTIARLADGTQDGEMERLILRGLIPLDKRDEGLDAVGVAVSVKEIYAVFDTRLTDYEARVHAAHLRDAR
jgi:predicted nucleotidyltransferase component of viral defense system